MMEKIQRLVDQKSWSVGRPTPEKMLAERWKCRPTTIKKQEKQVDPIRNSGESVDGRS